MKSTSYMFRAAAVSTLGLLAALAGCANAPTRLTTMEANAAPALAAPDDSTYEAPVPVNQISPQFPYSLRVSGITGSVEVVAWVDHTGKVLEARAQKYYNWDMANAALTAAKQWTFKPAMRNGAPVAGWVSIPFEFNLTDN